MQNPTSAEPPLPVLHRLADQFEEVVACVALAAVVLSVSWGVVTRYVTEQPAAWASEVATLAFAWLVFFGAAACIKYRMHPSIDMLVSRLPYGLRVAVRWLNHALVLGFCGFMVWFGTRFAIDAWVTPSAVLRLPLTWLYGPVAFSFALMAVRYVQVLRGHNWFISGERETNVG
jgi:TRAP-type C4-dicarboxylate transport system permease small subunit